MIEQALVTLIQGDFGVSTIASVGGFFSSQLPKGLALPSWGYTFAADKPDYTLDGPSGLEFRRVQIDCYANTAAVAISLTAAIDNVLNGYAGTVFTASSPITRLAAIYGCFRINLHDFFDEDGRTYRRMIEYELWFSQN